MSSSLGDLLAAGRGYESANHEPYTPLGAIEPRHNQYADCPERVCLYTESGGSECLETISCSTVPEHLRDAHEIKNMTRETVHLRMWQECGMQVTRHNYVRHFKMHHLGHDRVSGHAGEFLGIGRKALESKVLWQGESAEERENANSHSDSVHAERNESEPVDSSQHEVEIEQEDADRRVKFFQLEHDDPLPDVTAPGSAFWGFDASPLTPRTGLEARRTGLLSRLSILRRRKLPQCAQERMQTRPVAVRAAREKLRLLVAPLKANERESRTDQPGQGDTLYRIDTGTSAADTRDERISDDGYHGNYCVCYFKSSRSPEYRRR
ncbi:hypothetical protein F5141DRAFT_1169239 [Pisolithus sp. B1]|nr:hypothetical protein F5141DRAFT_1169239 [Pisolithus sp. B1]